MEVVKVFWWKHSSASGQYSSAKVHQSLKVQAKNPDRTATTLDDFTISVENLPGLTAEIIPGF